MQRGSHAGRCLPEYGGGFGIFTGYQRRHSGLEDSGLFPGNGSPGGTQQGAVVQPNGSNYSQLRRDDIGAVEPAAEAGLDHCNVHSLAGEPPEGQARGHFEKGESLKVGFAGVAAQIALEELPDLLFGGHGPAAGRHHLHPFAEVHQMRRSVEANAKSTRPTGRRTAGRRTTSRCLAPRQRCRNHAGHAALAVGARHVDAAVLFPGMSQSGIKGMHPGQAGLVCVA